MLAAHEYLLRAHPNMNQKTPAVRLMTRKPLHGMDIVPSVARLCAMNLFPSCMGGGEKSARHHWRQPRQMPAPQGEHGAHKSAFVVRRAASR